MHIDVDAGSTPPAPTTKHSKKSVLGSKADKTTAEGEVTSAAQDPTGTDKQLPDFYAQVDSIKVRAWPIADSTCPAKPYTVHAGCHTRQAACHRGAP